LVCRQAAGTREHHGVGAGEARRRLPQQAAWEEMSAAKWVAGIDGHEVEPAAEPAVLEAVVENRDIGPPGGGGGRPGNAGAGGRARLLLFALRQKATTAPRKVGGLLLLLRLKQRHQSQKQRHQPNSRRLALTCGAWA